MKITASDKLQIFPHTNTSIYIFFYLYMFTSTKHLTLGDTFLSLYCTDLLRSCPHKYVFKDFKTRGVKISREYKKS